MVALLGPQATEATAQPLCVRASTAIASGQDRGNIRERGSEREEAWRGGVRVVTLYHYYYRAIDFTCGA